MKLLITTQVYENYGAHDWDGAGECPSYWKAKGGSDYVVKNFTGNRRRSVADSATEAVMALRGKIEQNTEGFRETIVNWRIVANDYLTEFEQSQLKYEGKIDYPARELVW